MLSSGCVRASTSATSATSATNTPATPHPEPTPTSAPASGSIVSRPPIAEFPTGTHALLKPDARVYLRPDTDEPPVRLALRRASDETATPRWAVRIEGEDNGLLAVQLAEESSRCVDHPLALRDFELRLYVEIGDLAPVLVMPLSHHFDDGTAATVRPGTPVVDRDGQRSVEAAGIAVILPIPGGHIGTSYTPNPYAPPPTEEIPAFVDPTMMVDGRSIGPGWRLSSRADRPLALERWEHGGASFARVGNRCARFDVALTGDTTATLGLGRAIGMSQLRHIPVRRPSQQGPWYDVAKWTPLRGPEGTIVGTVRRDHEFRVTDAVQGPDGLVCFDLGVPTAVESTPLVVCVDEADAPLNLVMTF